MTYWHYESWISNGQKRDFEKFLPILVPQRIPLIQLLLDDEYAYWIFRRIRTLVQQRIVILNAFLKKTRETPERELELARKRTKEVING